MFALQRLSECLKRRPDTLKDLKFVLGTIADIRDMSLSMEMQFIDIQERYRTLGMYRVAVSLLNAFIPRPTIAGGSVFLLKNGEDSSSSPSSH